MKQKGKQNETKQNKRKKKLINKKIPIPTPILLGGRK